MTSGNTRGRVTGLVFNPWNLLLIIPFIVLLTPLYNRKSPELIGMPFFYWFQFLVIPIGVLCTIIVYRMTRTVPVDRTVPAAEPAADVPATDVPATDVPATETDEAAVTDKPAETDKADEPVVTDEAAKTDETDEGSAR